MIRITTITIVAAAAIAPAAAEPEAFSYHWYKRDVYWGKFYCGGRYHPEGCETWRVRHCRNSWRNKRDDLALMSLTHR